MANRLTCVIFVFIMAMCSGTALGQSFIDWNDDWYVEAGLRYGQNVPFVKRHAYIKEYPQYGLDLRLGRQTDGSSEWEQWFNYPTYGIMLRYEHNTLDSVKQEVRDANGDIVLNWVGIGDCYTLAGFINGHIYKGRRWSFDYGIIGGLSFWPRYGNEFIGSLMNVHLSLEAGPVFQVSKHFDVFGRAIFSHSSNGALVLPNNGVNVLSYQIGCRYHLNDRTDYLHTDSILWRKKTSLYVSESMGFLQTATRLEGQMVGETGYYFGNTLQVGVGRQFHPKFRFDVGLDFHWTGETKVKYAQAQQRYDNGTLEVELMEYSPLRSTHIAASAMFEILYDRFVFCIGGGIYLYHGIYHGTDEKMTWCFVGDGMTQFERQYLPNAYRNYYERLGFKYMFGKNRNQYVGAFMKVHLDSIDFIEWTYGIDLFRWEDNKVRCKR